VITLTLYDHAPDAVFGAMFDRIGAIEDEMSVNLADSEISAVNAAAGLKSVTVSDETFALLRAARDIAALSDGAFDPTVEPLVKLWGIGTPDAHVPLPEEIAAARALIGYRDLTLGEDNGVFLARENMGLDLGGIAKGYAGDEVLRVAREAGVQHAVLDLGGNIVVCGGRPDGKPWRIGLKNPEPGADGYFGVVSLFDGAVVTSGGYERYFIEDGVTYHHIFDPQTGYPADSGLKAVTIVDDNSTQADGLSTACFVLGLTRGMDLLGRIDGAEGVFVTDDNKVYVTPGLADRFEMTDGAYEFMQN